MAKDFVFPVRELVGDGFRVVPFESDVHGEQVWSETNSVDIWKYLPVGPFPTKEDFMRDVVEKFFEKDDTMQLYVVLTTRTPKSTSAEPSSDGSSNGESLAGLVGYLFASAVTLKLEIGCIVFFPRYQGIGLAYDVGELMSQHALKSTAEGGLGCRRVEWRANGANLKSQALAKKLGFKHEALLRWDRLLVDGVKRGKIGNGLPVPTSGTSSDIGADTVILSRCFDDQV